MRCVVVVSEERGSVSIFNNGNYIPVDDKKNLFSWVESHWVKTGSYLPLKRSFKKQAIFLIEMTASLLAAFVLWSSIIFSTTRIKEMSFAIPIEYMMASSDVAIMGEKPTAVRLKVSGSATDINMIKPNELKATIDLSSSGPGKQIITITKNNIHLPGGVNLIDAEPSVFEIDLQSFVENEVTIKPQLIGSLPTGLEISSIEVKPDKINILYSSDGKEPDGMYLTTTPIYLQNISEDTKLICNLISPPNIYPVGKQWVDVTVIIKLKAIKSEK